MQAHPVSVNRSFGAAVLTVALVLGIAACVPKKTVTELPQPTPAVANPDSIDVDTAYAKGLESFWTGDYATAAALFESLSRRLDDAAFRSKALYGLACARLAAARNQDEFLAARDLWQQWELASAGAHEQPDPRMLTPFLQNSKLFSAAKDVREAKVQAKLVAGEQDLSRRLQEKEKEVLHLQKQIKALEAIHQEIQEKKKMSGQ